MQYSWHNKTILVAEDDPINFKYLHLLLEKRTGCTILWAKDGIEARDKILQDCTIDLVLLDLQLPELTGMEVLREVRKSNRHLPILMQTANSWNNEEEDCVECGADAFFSKPLKTDLLFAKMDECLKTYSRLKKMKQPV